MLNERQIDLIIERLVRRITQGNSYILKRLGKILKKSKMLMMIRFINCNKNLNMAMILMI